MFFFFWYALKYCIKGATYRFFLDDSASGDHKFSRNEFRWSQACRYRLYSSNLIPFGVELEVKFVVQQVRFGNYRAKPSLIKHHGINNSMEFDNRSLALDAFCVIEFGITLCETSDRFALFPAAASRLRSRQVSRDRMWNPLSRIFTGEAINITFNR